MVEVLDCPSCGHRRTRNPSVDSTSLKSLLRFDHPVPRTPPTPGSYVAGGGTIGGWGRGSYLDVDSASTITYRSRSNTSSPVSGRSLRASLAPSPAPVMPMDSARQSSNDEDVDRLVKEALASFRSRRETINLFKTLTISDGTDPDSLLNETAPPSLTMDDDEDDLFLPEIPAVAAAAEAGNDRPFSTSTRPALSHPPVSSAHVTPSPPRIISPHATPKRQAPATTAEAPTPPTVTRQGSLPRPTTGRSPSLPRPVRSPSLPRMASSSATTTASTSTAGVGLSRTPSRGSMLPAPTMAKSLSKRSSQPNLSTSLAPFATSSTAHDASAERGRSTRPTLAYGAGFGSRKVAAEPTLAHGK
ncbi:hypothetical protein HDU96_000599, partial [Phlyctochytrium bullatum]